MAAYRITNSGKGPRGVHDTAGRLVWIDPGQTRTFEPKDIDGVRLVPTLEAEPVGEVGAPPASLKAAVAGKPQKPAARKRTRRKAK